LCVHAGSEPPPQAAEFNNTLHHLEFIKARIANIAVSIAAHDAKTKRQIGWDVQANSGKKTSCKRKCVVPLSG
jgi:hypothetical protein